MTRGHRCDLGDLDYSEVERGYIRCTTCPRQWVLMIRVDPKSGQRYARWIAQPCAGCDRQPCRCRPAARATA